MKQFCYWIIYVVGAIIIAIVSPFLALLQMGFDLVRWINERKIRRMTQRQDDRFTDYNLDAS